MAIVCIIYIFKRDLSSKNHFCFMYHNLNDFMENEHIQSFVVFWSVLTKLWRYKILNPAWVTSYYVCRKYFITGSLIFFLILRKKNLLHSFMFVLTISHELRKLQSFEWLNSISTEVTSYTQINIHNMLIVDHM